MVGDGAPAGDAPAAPDVLDAFVAPAIRRRIEERWWHPIEAASAAEAFLEDETFFADPGAHPGSFSDHGIVHVRDVARRAARLAEQAHGGLIPARPPERLRTVQAVAVLLAYLHDIGMVAATHAGRRVHAQFAAQTALSEGFDDIAADLWRTDEGGLRTRLTDGMPGESLLDGSPVDGPTVLREVLALSLAHSKSAVPAPLLDDPVALRRSLLRATFTALEAQMGLPHAALRDCPRSADAPTAAVARYDDVDAEAFAWLVDTRAVARRFVADVIDGVRVLRAADALRQRGTTQRTSAGYEVWTDLATGRALLAVRSRDERFAAPLWIDNVFSAAEANLRLSELTPEGSLRFAFQRTRFGSPEATALVIERTAFVIADVDADALGSFAGAGPGPGPGASRRIELLAPDGGDAFVSGVARALTQMWPDVGARVAIVPDEAGRPVDWEPLWWERAAPVSAGDPRLGGWFDRLGLHGLNLEAVDRVEATRGVRHVRLGPDEQVLRPGTAASFVAIPLGRGLWVHPVGGYRSAPLEPWLPVGVTGVVRAGERNAAVVSAEEVEVLVVPAERYLADWFRPYTALELRAAWARWRAADRG